MLSPLVSTLGSVPAAAKKTDPKWDAETHLGLVRRARRMNRTLAVAFPHVYCELDFTNPLELTVATILSAQSTDKRVNLTTPALFDKYRTALDYAQADRTELEELIRPTGFYRNKANSLIRLGQELVERFDGRGAAHHGRTGDAARRRAQDRQRDPRATPSTFPASPSTPTSAGSSGAGAGPPKRIRSRSSTPSGN